MNWRALTTCETCGKRFCPTMLLGWAITAAMIAFLVLFELFVVKMFTR